MASSSVSDVTSVSFSRMWWRSLALPMVLIAAIGIILVPMPPLAMDLLLSFNLALSVMILMGAIFVRKPLDFSSFPTVLLTIVMFRLALNIATTRMILTNAEEKGTNAAGRVIEAFSGFVASGNLVIGSIIFLIILIIQFVVITKGAGRISEVSARFTLDGLPGKQQAIDAELQSGVITKEEARKKRQLLGDEVDFYGAMDGASKFVRGDAVAGLGITFVNILGGLAIGLTQGNHSLSEVVEIYSRLTIGDGLVSQLPAFLVAIGAAVLVTRSNREKKLAEDVQRQLFSSPVVLGITGFLLFLLALTPLPKLPLMILGGGCELLAFMLWSDLRKGEKEAERMAELEEKSRLEKEARKAAEVQIRDAIQQEAIELEIGSELVSWTQEDGEFDLLGNVQELRRHLAREFGFLMPAVRISSGGNISWRKGETWGNEDGVLDGTAYRVRIHGSIVAEQVLRPEFLLAVEGIYAAGEVKGLQTTEPIHQLPAVWIAKEDREEAEEAGYEIFSAGRLLIEHLGELALQFAPELLTHEDVQNLIGEFAKTAPATVRDVVPELLSIQEIQHVLQQLLAERIPIRNLGLILETLGEAARHTRHTVELTESVRLALGRLVTSRYLDTDGILHVLTLSPALETRITESFELTEDRVSVFPDPAELERLIRNLSCHVQRLQLLGISPVLLVSAQIRPALREMISSIKPALPVLSIAEVPKSTRVKQEECLGER